MLKSLYHRLFHVLLTVYVHVIFGERAFIFYGTKTGLSAPENIDDMLHGKFSSPLKTGTTIVGICCRNGIVLGADTRSTGGPLVMDKNKLKIHTISKNIMACAAGTSADCDQITRKARHFLQLVKIEKELALEYDTTDTLVTAVTSISDSIRTSETNQNSRKVQSVMIVGGVDSHGPSLFQIDAQGVLTRISYGALGSGCTDALAVLENARQTWHRRNYSAENSLAEPHIESISVEEAIPAVRRAVQAGILNDLGSGSHVDLCVITAKGTRTWRETQVSSWDRDRLQQDNNEVEVKVEVGMGEGQATHFMRAADELVATSSVPRGLGRRVFSRLRPRKRITLDGTVEEKLGTCAADDDLSLNIDMID